MFSSFNEAYHDTIQNMKDCGFFSKPIRNVPQYARKKEQGRNEKCKCGSGKKYKHCCGK